MFSVAGKSTFIKKKLSVLNHSSGQMSFRKRVSIPRRKAGLSLRGVRGPKGEDTENFGQFMKIVEGCAYQWMVSIVEKDI